MKKRLSIFCVVMMGLVIIMLAGAETCGPKPLVQEGRPGDQIIEAEDVADIVEVHIQRMIGDRRKRVEVKEIRGYERTVLPPGSLSYEVSVSDQAYRGGHVSTMIHFLVNGQVTKKRRVTAEVNIFADVVAARSYLKKHHVIQEKDLQWVNKNMAHLPPDVVTEFEEAVGKRTTITMNSQEVFRKTMVERTPVVKKGDRITLLVENSRFRITSLGEVQEEGGKGDRVRVLNVSSKREVYGRVLDANTAQIDY